MFPLYVTTVIPVIGIAAVISLILVLTGYIGSVGRRRIGRVFLVVCLLSLGYIAKSAYQTTLPTVDDRNLLVLEYQPFKDGNQLVTLDEPADFQLENVSSLRLDGATALYPVYAAFVQATFPENAEYSPFHSTVECNGTVDAYKRLINGEANMIFAAGPSKAQLEAAEQAGLELHMTPIGREAFVFFVNSQNPVTSLTVEQIQGIYSGEITTG